MFLRGKNMGYKIFTVNSGSTSTKIALFDGDKTLLYKTVEHDAKKLKEFTELMDQLPFRHDAIQKELDEAGIDLGDVDAYVGRGGGLLAVEGGIYKTNDILIDHATRGANGFTHPAQLGSLLAKSFADIYGKPTFVVNPPDTDELIDEARMTGIKGIYRQSHMHALNLKETAIRHAKAQGKKYEEQNYVVCHIGGGLSVSAHRKGRMIDGNDNIGGDGPMAPTRCGAIPAAEMIELCFASHLGTSDAREVKAMIAAGNKTAERVWNGMMYQIVKFIGSMAAALHGEVDGILLGGGMVHDKDLVEAIREGCEWIAPVFAYPGEFEMEAMAAGAIRALTGEEEAKEYTGIPSWNGFDD